MIILAVLILLHSPQDRAIYVNPKSVTTMRAAVEGKTNEYLTGKARCLLNTMDGKFIAVIEPCETVRALIEDKKQ